MYAVIESGGKQYRVQPGDFVQVEKITGEIGSTVKFDRVLFLSQPQDQKSEVWIGKPYVSKALVEGQVVGQGRGDKIMVFKMKRRKQYRRRQGHRQFYTHVLITKVENGSGAQEHLSDKDCQEKLKKFQSHLTPKGPARTASSSLVSKKKAGSKKPSVKAPTKKTSKKKVTAKASSKKAKTAKKAKKVTAKKASSKKTATKKTAKK